MLDDTLKIDASFVGIEDSPWSIDITMDCAAGQNPATIFHDDGKIPNGGGQGISTNEVVLADPCAKHKEAATSLNAGLNVVSQTPADETAGRRVPEIDAGQNNLCQEGSKKRITS
jgi:hypothetical protein